MEEEVPLLLAREAVEAEGVLARHQVGVQRGPLAPRGHRLERLGGDGQEVADAVGVDDDVVGTPDE
jgi:hypothetical protein